MKEMIIDGDITAIFDKNQITDTFCKREFVVETSDEYPQQIKIEFTQAKCDELEKYKVGDTVSVSVNIRGRKWTNKEGKDVYFVTIQAWRIEKLASSDIDPINSNYADEHGYGDSFADDLPF
jgi:single-stranded DNA-binding protein